MVVPIGSGLTYRLRASTVRATSRVAGSGAVRRTWRMQQQLQQQQQQTGGQAEVRQIGERLVKLEGVAEMHKCSTKVLCRAGQHTAA